MKNIIDLLFLVILLVCAWSGYKKGLIMGIGGLLAIAVAIYSGSLLSETFSYEVVPAVRPFAQGYMEGKFSEAVYMNLGYEPNGDGEYEVEISVADLIEQNPGMQRRFCVSACRLTGIYPSTAEVIADETLEYAQENGKPLKESLVEVLCLKVAYALGFLLAFLMVLIVLTVLGNLTNLSFKIPYIGLVNDLGGLALGLVTGMALCAVAAWALKFMGILITDEVIDSTRLVSWFMEKDYLLKYLGL